MPEVALERELNHEFLFTVWTGQLRSSSMAISYHLNNEGERAHIWRSYDNPYTNTAWDRSARIWQVARATSATPGYFDAIEIAGATYLDGCLVANNPSYTALREVLDLHGKTSVVFVNIGTGSRTEVNLRSDARWRDRSWRDRLQQGNRLFEHTITESHAYSETKQWLELSESMGIEKAYRLSGAEENLQKISYDD